MAWEEPKTDWAERYDDLGEYIGDFINVADYNRICSNLQHLKDLYIYYNKNNVSFESFIEITLSSLATAEQWNIIERNAEKIIVAFGGLYDEIGNMQQFTENGQVIDFTELNRLESISAYIYKLLPIEYEAQSQIELGLGLDNIGEFSTLKEIVPLPGHLVEEEFF